MAKPIRFLDQIVLADPGNADWQRHFARAYGAAADALGFDGFHVDTYGYPRFAPTSTASGVDMRGAYAAFLERLRAARPRDLLSFNQVNGVPAAARLPGGPGFRYCEVWPPNGCWRHFEGLLDRSLGTRRSAWHRDAERASSRHDRVLPAGLGTPEAGQAEDARERAYARSFCTEAIVHLPRRRRAASTATRRGACAIRTTRSTSA